MAKAKGPLVLSLAKARALLAEVGFKNATKMNAGKVEEHITKYGEIDEIDKVEIEDDEDLAKLHDELLTACDKGREIKISEEGADEQLAKAIGGKPAKKAKTEEAAEGEDKPKGKRPEKAPGGGVIGTIVELLQKASSAKPISKATILEHLSKKFPDRDADGMKKTINIQVPTRIRKDKGMEIEKNENGYWIEVVPAGKPVKAKK